jgi:hypothetical protein
VSRASIRQRVEGLEPLCAWRGINDSAICEAEAEFHLPGDDHEFVAPWWHEGVLALLAVADAADALETALVIGDEDQVGFAADDLRAALAALEAQP